MKSLSLQSAHFLYLEKSYQEWLQTIGYADPTVNNWPAHVHELLHYLESRQVQHITTVSHLQIQDFIFHIKYRKNHSRAGALSSSSINTIINAINSFARYLNSTGKYVLDLTLERAEADQEVPVVLCLEIVRSYILSIQRKPCSYGPKGQGYDYYLLWLWAEEDGRNHAQFV